jgi:isopropylmalate/homocitrate/citramalate synthase
VQIYDWTLEGDGEEMPGMIFTEDERLEIAKSLDEIGVNRINVGWLSSAFPEDIGAIRKVAKLGLAANVEVCVEMKKSTIDLATESDVGGVLMELPSSDAWIESHHMSREKVLDQAIEMITYAKNHGLSVTFGLQDATRADRDFLKGYVETLTRETKLDVMLIADSMSVASPEGFHHLIRMIKKWTMIPIAVHCHDDFGLATANAIAAISAGANIVTTTVNGIGERCGLTSLEEVAVALRVLYGVDTGIKLESLCKLSRTVERATTPLISSLKSVVGDRAFAWEMDRFVEAKRALDASGLLRAGLPYEPDLVGNDFKFYPGKKIGVQGIKWEAERLGFNLTDQEAEQLVDKIRELSKQKRQPSSEDFLNMLREQ